MREGGICGTLQYICEAHVSPTEAKCYFLSKSVMRSKYAIESCSISIRNCHIL